MAIQFVAYRAGVLFILACFVAPAMGIDPSGGKSSNAEAAGVAKPASAIAPPASSATSDAAAKIVEAVKPKGYADPKRFEKSILAFEAQDAKQTPAPGGVVCIGSSSMVGWHGTIKKDLAPLPIIARGFGGSNMNDALHYVERMVIRYRPKAVVLYEGDNDIGAGIAPELIRDNFKAFCAAVHKQLPETRVYVLSIKPSIKRWALWPKAQKANELMEACCKADEKRLKFINIAEVMLGADGQPNPEIFKTDKLHMNAKGYELWRERVRPVLLAEEGSISVK